MSQATALVTGGAGFLGSHLCERLLAEDLRVVCVDNLCTGHWRNVAHLASHPHFVFVEQDAARVGEWDGRVDYVLHLASPASPVDYARLPIETLKAGSLGTFATVELALRHGAVYLLASTSEVYGDPEVHPQAETYWGRVNPVGARSAYDEAKRFAEATVTAYRRVQGLDARIARIFNTYGPRMRRDDGRVIPSFVSQALAGESLTVFGDGTQTRSFCHVDDTVDGLWRLLQSDRTQPTNLGNPQETTINELADLVISLTGSAVSIERRPLPSDDPRRRCPDISAAQRDLGWSVHVPLAEGLLSVVRHYSQLQTPP